MKRVLNSLFTVAMAVAMIGVAVTQARADRVTLNGGCFSLSCVPETLTVNGIPLSFTTSTFAADATAANATRSEFEANTDITDLSVATPNARQTSVAPATSTSTSRNVESVSASVPLLSNSFLWSFGGSSLNATRSVSSELAFPISHTQNASFSVVSATAATSATVSFAKGGKGIHASSDPNPNIVGGPAATVPEPTTMLLFGTGLVGAAAVLRRRLRAQRSRSK